MSSKKLRFLSIIGSMLIVLIVGISLLMTYLPNGTQQVLLPQTQPSASDDGSGSSGATPAGLINVSVDTDNVQSVVATLTRPESYSRTVAVERFYTGGSAVDIIDVSVYDYTTALEIFGNNQNKHIVISKDALYIWFDGDSQAYVGAVDTLGDEKRSSDEYQMMISYEDVLELDKSAIMEAGYDEFGGETCIYIKYVSGQLGYVTTCHVSVGRGLLTGADQYDGDDLVYRMTATDFSASQPEVTVFDLPDGTNPVSAP